MAIFINYINLSVNSFIFGTDGFEIYRKYDILIQTCILCHISIRFCQHMRNLKHNTVYGLYSPIIISSLTNLSESLRPHCIYTKKISNILVFIYKHQKIVYKHRIELNIHLYILWNFLHLETSKYLIIVHVNGIRNTICNYLLLYQTKWSWWYYIFVPRLCLARDQTLLNLHYGNGKC